MASLTVTQLQRQNQTLQKRVRELGQDGDKMRGFLLQNRLCPECGDSLTLREGDETNTDCLDCEGCGKTFEV